MWDRIRRKKLKLQRKDYVQISGSPYADFDYMTKEVRKFLALGRPDLVKAFPRYSLVCELIESYRKGKKNLQRTIYVASIAEENLDSHFSRERFWKSVDYKLKKLKLAPRDENKIRRSINKRVRCPTERQLANEKVQGAKKYDDAMRDIRRARSGKS